MPSVSGPSEAMDPPVASEREKPWTQVRRPDIRAQTLHSCPSKLCAEARYQGGRAYRDAGKLHSGRAERAGRIWEQHGRTLSRAYRDSAHRDTNYRCRRSYLPWGPCDSSEPDQRRQVVLSEPGIASISGDLDDTLFPVNSSSAAVHLPLQRANRRTGRHLCNPELALGAYSCERIKVSHESGYTAQLPQLHDPTRDPRKSSPGHRFLATNDSS